MLPAITGCCDPDTFENLPKPKSDSAKTTAEIAVLTLDKKGTDREDGDHIRLRVSLP